MTVEQLIDILNKIEDKTKVVDLTDGGADFGITKVTEINDCVEIEFKKG